MATLKIRERATGPKRRRRPFIAFTSFLLASVTVLTACGDGSDQGTITIRVADAFPTSHVVAEEGIQFWMDMVEKETNGRVEFDYYPAEQLISSEELYPSVKDGVVDIAYVAPASFSSELPLSDVPTVPGFQQGSSATVSEAYREVINDILLDEEFLPAGVRPMIAFASGPYEIMTTGEPIASPDSLNGKGIRTAGGTGDFTIKALGASAVALPGAEMFTAMQRGTIDGAHYPISGMTTYDLGQVVKAVTTNAPLGSGASTYLMNEQTWQGLPADVRDAMESATEAANLNLAEAYDASRVDVIDESTESVEFYELSDTVVEEWTSRFADVQANWIKDRENRGLAAREVLEAWSQALGAARESAKD